MSDTINELKRCPFCGEHPDIDTNHYVQEDMYRIRHPCRVGFIEMGWDKDREKLIRSWNRRYGDNS